VRHTGRKQVVISAAVSPIFREMVKCYAANLDVELIEIPVEDGQTESNLSALADAVTVQTACVLVQYPNFFGEAEDYTELVNHVHAQKAIAVCAAYPLALGMLRSPGEIGFDVACGEGQSLGIPLSFGGPYLGYIAVTKDLMRKMPGRIVGRTVDLDGKPGFVLTLQTREQHIRRENATSNICSNESLCALMALVYLSCAGKAGLVDITKLCASKAVFARNELLKIKGVQAVGGASFFNEFVIKVPGDASEVAARMLEKGYAAGFPLGHYYGGRRDQLLVAITEKRTKEEIDGFVKAMEAALWN